MATLIVESKFAAFLKWFVVGVCIGSLCAAMSGCAGAGRALDAAGQHSTQIGLGGAAGAAVSFLGWPGLAACAVAGAVGVVACVLSTPPASAAAAAPGFPWSLVILVVLGVLVARAWAHYPKIMLAIWETVKAAARGLLGGRAPK